MKRTNTFAIKFKNEAKAFERANGCSALWNVLNYKRRQSFFNNNGNIDWDYSAEYKSFAPNIGSSTAQQIIRKNDSAWRIFFKLLKLKSEGKLPPHIEKVNPPGYWKDRKTGLPILRILIRFDEYKIKGRIIKFSKNLKGRIYGNLKWAGKQGLLFVRYDGLRHKWYAYMPVETQAFAQPIGHRQAYVDFGVRYPITAIITEKPIAYNGSPMLSDWWYWNDGIAKHQATLNYVNDSRTSKRLKKFYRTRQLRFRHAINNLVKDFVQRCYDNGVNEIIAGDLTCIRDNGSKGKKSNTMINNFWSHKYLADRLTYTAENYGISVKLVDERGTSSVCPRCGSDNKTRRGRLFKCKDCGLEAHRDCVGAFNIGLVHGNLSREGDSNGMMTHPEVVNDFCSFHTNNLRAPAC